ncbi:MAG TPA: alanine racemase [Thermodesulfobacteriota bacterium]|nr:alanine racemase [Thermodesulfobacteriota bacterium]
MKEKFVHEKIGGMKICRPTLLLDKARVLQNLGRMKKKADAAGVRFRPHFKTHQSAEIGSWFRRAVVECITVSSADMARYFAAHGWRDITVAFTCNTPEMDSLNALAREIRLQLLVDSVPLVRILSSGLSAKVDLWIDVDVGYRRTGIPCENFDRVLSVAREAGKSDRLSLAGLLTHSGHTYHASSVDEIRGIHRDSLAKLCAVRDKLGQAGIRPCLVSIGDTPSCSLADSFSGADEIRPGNFIFHDLTMSGLGACRDEDIAVAVACPVVAKYREWNQAVIYGGAVHLSKEFLTDDQGRKVYGYFSRPGGPSWGAAERRAPVVSLSQEHGLIHLPDSLFDEVEVGDLLPILPVHSCLTVDLYRSYLTLDGEIIGKRQSNDVP